MNNIVNITFQGPDFNTDRNPQCDDGFRLSVPGFDLDYATLTVYTDPADGYNHVLAVRAPYQNENGDECGEIAWRIKPEQSAIDALGDAILPHIGKVYGRVIVTSGGFAVDE